VFARRSSLSCAVSWGVAILTRRDDVFGSILSSVLPSSKVLCRALKSPDGFGCHTEGVCEFSVFAKPHLRFVVVAALALLAKCVFS
jgi:hypothetical protein